MPMPLDASAIMLAAQAGAWQLLGDLHDGGPVESWTPTADDVADGESHMSALFDR